MALAIREPIPLLSPLSWIYGGVIRIRNRLYDLGALPSVSPQLPVISVGNIIAGGSGKTPFCRSLALALYERGRRPVILSRGYGGSDRGPTRVTADAAPSLLGDEAVMQARSIGAQVPIVVSRKRAEGVSLIDRERLGDVVVLDDGFQHRGLKRHVNLLLLDSSSEERINRWRGGTLLPAGWLREPLELALERVDGIILVEKSATPPKVSLPASVAALPAFRFQLAPGELRDGRSGAALDVAQLQASQVGTAPFVGVTAIADPESFFRLLADIGVALNARHVYPDHAHFSPADARTWCSRADAIIFCTEKDLAKVLAVAPPDLRVVVLPLTGRFENPVEGERLMALIDTLLSRPPHN